jgi:hypothetical protein
MDSVNVQIYKIDIGKLIFVKKKLLILIEILRKPEALKSLYRSPGYKKNQLVLCKNYVLQW